MEQTVTAEHEPVAREQQVGPRPASAQRLMCVDALRDARRQIKAGGLKDNQVQLTTPALREIVDGYAREPGVRSMENAIKKICRKAARKGRLGGIPFHQSLRLLISLL